MLCLLCGRSDDQRSIMPCDPRGPKPEHSDFDWYIDISPEMYTALSWWEITVYM